MIDFLQHHPCCPDGLEIYLDVPESPPTRTLSEAEGNKSSDPNSTYVLLGCARSIAHQEDLFIKVPLNNVLFNENFDYDSNEYKIDAYQFKNQEIHSIESKARIRAQNEFFTNGKFGFDVFETIFFHISRVEEWYLKADQLDLYNRMKAEEMILVKNGLEKTPVVDRLVVAFFEALGFEPKTFPTKINWTHDIDIIQKFPSFKKVVFAFGNMLLKQRDIGGFFRLTKQYLNFLKTGKDPFDTFDWLLKKENYLSIPGTRSWHDSKSSHESEGKSLQKSEGTSNNKEKVKNAQPNSRDDLKSCHEYEINQKTIYILSGGEVPKIENHFNLNNPRVLEFINLAKSRGYEIGIHPSFNGYLKKALFKKEKEALEDLIGHSVHATRQHFLRWKFPETPRIIEEFGLKTDSTIGFSDRIGFRCGTGFAYRLYDFEKEHAFEFLEIPMVVMDVGLMRDSFFKDDNSYLDLFLSENSQNTLVTFNFHNSGFDEILDKNIALKLKHLALKL